MPRPEYRDDKTKTVYLEKVAPDAKEDFLDICHLLDTKNQSAAFEEIVSFYKAAKKVKPRPSRGKG